MKRRHSRVCLYPKDIQLVTGLSYKQARLYLQKLKMHYARESHQYVSISEFCAYAGLELDEVLGCLGE